jgi:hypothetical protein
MSLAPKKKKKKKKVKEKEKEKKLLWKVVVKVIYYCLFPHSFAVDLSLEGRL